MVRDSDFDKINKKDGSAKQCKFCHAEVWWHKYQGRWYDVGGETLHVTNCDKGKAYYHERALDGVESVRQKKAL